MNQISRLIVEMADAAPTILLVELIRSACDEYIEKENKENLEFLSSNCHLLIGKLIMDEKGKDKMLGEMERFGQLQDIIIDNGKTS